MNIVRKIAWKLFPPDEFTSESLRAYYKSNFGIEVGLFSYGCFDERRIYPKTFIGRYCSFSSSCRVVNRNHGSSYMSFTPYLYEKKIAGGLDRPIEQIECYIEDDVWIGHNAVLLPGAAKIGRGSAIGAGSVVTKNVPPYSIVVGNPGRVIRQRFSDQRIAELEDLRWWEWDAAQLTAFVRENPTFAYGDE